MDDINDSVRQVDNRLIVYTALFGNYDRLIDPPIRFPGCDFICFTDQAHLSSDVWDIRLVEKIDLSPAMMNRWYKIFPHMIFPQYEKSLYVDANIEILKNPLDLSNKYLSKTNFSSPKHFARSCIYDEARECIVLRKDSVRGIKRQISRYRQEGFPEKFGLSENNILFRNHLNPSLISLMEKWWRELLRETGRDQLSLSYVMWVSGVSHHFMDESSRDGKGYFSYKMHSEFNSQPFVSRLKDFAHYSLRRFIFKGC